MIEEHSAGAIIYIIKDGSIYYLLLNSAFNSNYWDIPKGRILENEIPENTAKREAKEEANLEIEIMKGFKEKVCYAFKREDEVVMKYVTIFLGKAKNDNVMISKEHAGYKWADFEEARKLLKKEMKSVFEKAHKFVLEELFLKM
jgi:8-oxo-dGTP pyrophosphatase MutT (NUDIX family)